MSETKDKEKEKKTLSLGKGTLSLKAGSKPPVAQKNQSVSHGRGKTVAVEVRRKRATPADVSPPSSPDSPNEEQSELQQLTSKERESRMRALKEAEETAQKKKEEAAKAPKQDAEEKEVEDKKAKEEEQQRQKELAELQKIEEEERVKQDHAKQEATMLKQEDPHAKIKKDISTADKEEEESYRARMKRQTQRRPTRTPAGRRRGKITVTQVLNEDYARDRGPSLAAQKRARERARMALQGQEEQKITREVVLPETITVQELANRMAERGHDVIRELMKIDVMATVNETIDADTAELIIHEFGHTVKRVTDADIEIGIEGDEDNPEDMITRPPVVTIMGHVDHGKTSLLDALRGADVVAGEAGGITQHIGAYQVTREDGGKITFLDTPGHAAFTEMRSRGANVTDIVILVVAANDSIMPQTIEAINHAKAAGVPLIVAINKVDLPDANVQKVKNDLLQYEVISEDLGGDTQCIEVSAKQKTNLDALEDAILLQADLLEIKANPNRSAVGTVVEAKLDKGRGSVATILVERGTLRIGDIFVAGKTSGRVRAMIDDQGKNVEEAGPGKPVEILGSNDTPESGDQFVIVEDEAHARDIAEYRDRKKRERASVISAGGSSFEDLLAHSEKEQKNHLELVIKGDVHGSVEAIIGSLDKIKEENEDVHIRVLHSGAGGITESDVILADASGGIIIGFNVRANPQARELAEKNGTDIRYYNVIYDVIDDAKQILTGMLAPVEREEYLGQAKIKQVFRITKAGNVAGCDVTTGSVKRGAKVRLLRDDVVIHEGTLKTLKRHKDEVKEVKEGTECGMAFENYEDIKEDDIIECYEIIEVARTVE